MSNELRNLLPEISDESIEQLQSQYVHIVIDCRISSERKPLHGILQSFLLDDKPELEIKIPIIEALNLCRNKLQTQFHSLELLYGEHNWAYFGIWNIKAIRIQEINHETNNCIVSMQLQKIPFDEDDDLYEEPLI